MKSSSRLFGLMGLLITANLFRAVFVLSPAATGAHASGGYDPLSLPAGDVVSTPVPLDVKDQQRQRDIPILVYLPAAKSPAPVVLFSHGLGGSRENNPYLGKHWAGRGYAVVFMQHQGSDTSVWKDKPLLQRMAAMREAASLKNFLLRVKDIPAVLDQLERWNKTPGHILEGRLNTAKIGMSGHSFGAVTTQAVSGQTIALDKALCTDARITAALMMSPSSPARGTPAEAFGKVSIPWMLMTGTKDNSLIGNTDVESRLAVFPALPPGGKYELVLYNAEHNAFSERALPGETEKRNPNHHRAILALSTAFWDAYLRSDSAAKAWLHGTGPESVLEKNDRWRMK